MAWTESDGPVSTPPRPVAYFAGALIVAAAFLGLGLGFRASERTEHPGVGSADQSLGVDAATPARPLVEIPALPTQTAAANTATNAADDQDEADDNSIDAQTAEAQQIQSKPSKGDSSIDDVLTSPSEKPQAPAKPSSDEAPPGEPTKGKSDVPF